ncbi:MULTISPECIES: metal-dependent hydrolase [Thalassolituus]|jgi:predicted metal-dependent hydrolase|uniref:Metal-dependent hydrolase n=1 Tax=hydrothermal vent metagenome TaxID=652676 RepID=A0A160TBH5_9ZZZZ|nr:metal-dependent hydrolase [Thalassolituus oleivorans]APR68258.1 metal-dependent hydrolase [Thalassolituus oleivorans]
MTQATLADTNTGNVRMTAGERAGIPPRRMDFEFSEDTNRYWYGDNAFLTTFWTTLSSLFPEGETFFVDSVKNYRDIITDPQQKAQVSGFIGQEAMHSKEHAAFNNMAAKHGFPAEQLDKELGILLNLGRKILPKKIQLAITVALEHYTAILAEQLLRDERHQQMIKDPEALKLWMWHALEENEHKVVAYDVYELAGGGYFTRTLTMIITTFFFFAVVGSGHIRLLWANKSLFKFKDNWKGLTFLWGWKGLFPQLAGKYLDFFRPGFHPNDHDTVALLDEWRHKMLDEGGMLADQIKNPSRAAKSTAAA